jgi:hypothetical protein
MTLPTWLHDPAPHPLYRALLRRVRLLVLAELNLVAATALSIVSGRWWW